MTHFLGYTMMIVFVFVVFVFLGRPASGELELLDGLVERDHDLVKWAGYGEEKLSTILISGRVLCHGDAVKETTSIHPYPVSGATVGVFCGASGEKKKKCWAKGNTDSSGSFLIDVPSHLHAIPNLEKVCHVKAVHLPGSRCPCAGKRKAIKLSSIGDGIRTYTTHNIHLMPRKHT